MKEIKKLQTSQRQATPAALSTELNVIANLIRDVANVDRNADRLKIARDVKELAWQVSKFQTVDAAVLDNLQIVVAKLPTRVFPDCDASADLATAPAGCARLVGACDRFATFHAE